jgi:drug/metabolite transporter (DMT)-like permease
MKIGLDGIGPYNLIALRFGIAFFAMSLIFLPRYRQLSATTLAKGVFMGIILFLIFYGMVNGVNHTTASTASFLTSTTVVMVPVLECLLKRTLPSKTIVISILLSLADLFLLTAKDGIVFDTGAAYCLTGAFFYAVYIIVFAKLAKGNDTLLISIIQLGVASLTEAVFMFLSETPSLPTTPRNGAPSSALHDRVSSAHLPTTPRNGAPSSVWD